MGVASNSKYRPLTAHLAEQRSQSVPMSFAEIERVLGAKLPPSAASHRAWWSNNPNNNVMTRAWLDAGFQSERVDIEARRLVFKRVTREAPIAEPSDKLALFGCLRGTVTSTGDLTEPADPDWGERLGDE